MGNFGGLGGLGGLGGPASGPSLRVTIGKNKGDPVVMGLLKSTMFPLQQVLEGEHAAGGVCSVQSLTDLEDDDGWLVDCFHDFFHPAPDE